MPVSKGDLAAYKEFAENMAVIAKRHCALQYVNCIADDIKPGKETSFPKAVKLHDGEVVVQSGLFMSHGKNGTVPTKPSWKMRASRNWDSIFR